MNSRWEQKLRAARLDDRVEDALHRRIVEAAVRPGIPAAAPKGFRWGLAGVAAASVVVAVALLWRPQPQPTAETLQSLARWLEQPLPVQQSLQAVSGRQLEAEWLALNADFERIRQQLSLQRIRSDPEPADI